VGLPQHWLNAHAAQRDGVLRHRVSPTPQSSVRTHLDPGGEYAHSPIKLKPPLNLATTYL